MEPTKNKKSKADCRRSTRTRRPVERYSYTSSNVNSGQKKLNQHGQGREDASNITRDEEAIPSPRKSKRVINTADTTPRDPPLKKKRTQKTPKCKNQTGENDHQNFDAKLLKQPPLLVPQYAKAVFDVATRSRIPGDLPPERPQQPFAVVALPSGNIACMDISRQHLDVQVYNRNMKFLHNFRHWDTPEHPFTWVAALAVDCRGQIYISGIENRIFVTNEQGHVLRTLGSDQKRTCSGSSIAVDPTGSRLYICNRGNCKLEMLTTEGHFIETRTCLGLHNDDKYTATAPWHVSTNYLGQVFVSDCAGDIYVLDKDGRDIKSLQHVHNGKDSGFRRADGTASDPWGNLLVADSRGKCIVVLDSQGQYVCDIKTDVEGTTYVPTTLALTIDGDILLCDQFNSLIARYKVPCGPIE